MGVTHNAYFSAYGHIYFGSVYLEDDGPYVPPPQRNWLINALDGSARVVNYPSTPLAPVITAGDGQAIVG